MQREFLVAVHARLISLPTDWPSASVMGTTLPLEADNTSALVLVARSVSHPRAPVLPSAARGRILTAGLLLRPTAGRETSGEPAAGAATEVHYGCHVDIGETTLPSWVLQATMLQHSLLLNRLARGMAS